MTGAGLTYGAAQTGGDLFFLDPAGVEHKVQLSASGTCSDGIKNQDEDGVDCGGVCRMCRCDEGVYCPNKISRIYFAELNCKGSVLGYSYKASASCATNSDDTTWSGNGDVKIGDRRTLNYGSFPPKAGNLQLKWGRITALKATRTHRSTLNYGKCTNHHPPNQKMHTYLVEVEETCFGPE